MDITENMHIPILLLVCGTLPVFAETISPRECISIVNDDFSKCYNMLSKGGPPGSSTTCKELEASANNANQQGQNQGGPGGPGGPAPGGPAPGKPAPGGPAPANGGASLPKAYTCKYKDLCDKTYRKMRIQLDPFSIGMSGNIDGMIEQCCGTCAKTCMVSTIKDISKLNITLLNQTDILFPVFSATSASKLYGYWYIPLVDVPYAFYVTKRLEPKDIMSNMLGDFKALWPLLIICIIFAITAGFLIWVLDTWGNREEFPREFLIGWFEGFWWSFISMTTVGYGDKAPKSRFARLFSIGWILIGITIFSMLTASLSNIITNSEKPPSSDMAGKKIGALQYRIYDATVIAKHGGRLRVVPHENLTHGIDRLLDMLLSKEHSSIDGFLIGKHSYLFYCNDISRCDRFQQTIRTSKHLDNEKYSYGMLIREKAEYAYFKTYIEYNWYNQDTCMDLALNEQSKNLKPEEKFSLMSAESGVFVPTLIAIAVMICVFALAGMVIEITSRKKNGKTSSALPTT